MGLLTILAIYISFILLLVFVLLFGPSPRFRHGIVGKAHVFITETIWIFLGQTLTRIFGEGALSKCNGCWSYISEQRNPSLQILYLFFITGSIVVFMNCGYGLLDATTLSPIHKRFIIPFVIAFTYACFFLACAIGPGEINSQNVKVALDVYPYDHLMFYPKNCGTCKLQKPARSKHCSVCNICVPRSDHHCGWINQCVGHKNHRYFILFLYSAVQICWYGTYLIHQVFKSRMYDSAMYKILVRTRRWDMLGPFRNYHLLLYQAQTDRALGGLGVFAFLAGLVVFIFFLYNLYLIARGVTTNESFKWEEIGEMIHRRELIELVEVDSNGVPIGHKRFEQRDRHYRRHTGSSPQGQHLQPSQKPQPFEQPQQSQQSQQQQQHHSPQKPHPSNQIPRVIRETVITDMKYVDNIYDQGVKANLRSILWPPSLDTPSSDRGHSKPLYERVQKSKKGA